MRKPTIAAGYAKALLDFAVSKGAQRRTLMERSHIDAHDLENQDNRIPLPNYIALLRAGIELCNEPALALLFGEAVRMKDISILGLMDGAFDSLQSAHELMNRYAALALDPDLGTSADPLQFIRENGDIWLKFTGDIYVDYPLLTESAFARNVCGGREFLHSSGIAMEAPFLKAIRFTYEEPGYRAEYDRIFGVPLFFSSHMNGFLIDEGLLHLKLPQSNPYLSDILKDRAEQLLKNLEDSKSTAGQVESLLRSSLHTGEADMENIARKLGVSRHTLFRKLRAEGVTFEKILDELRYKMALQYLVKEKMSVNETTYLLGFSDPATFSRVFKRWTGASPRIYLSRRDSPDS